MSIISQLDEPYADPSVVPSYILSKEISNKFKVAISGDGGDELLGGYLRIANILKNKNKLKNITSYLIFTRHSSEPGAIFLKTMMSYLYDEKFMNLLGEVQ